MQRKASYLRKIVVPSFVLLIGASLAATISSTVAWFQYATRAQVAYVDALTHCSKLLKISVDNGLHWGNEYYKDEMKDHINGNHLVPITSGKQNKDEGLVYHVRDVGGQNVNCVRFYTQPDLGRGGNYSSSNWSTAIPDNYAQFTILVKVNDVDGSTSTTLVNDVYITKLLIEDDSANGTGSDLSDAVRVHLAVTDAANNTKYLLFAKNVEQTKVGGYLDLNNDGVIDKDIDSWGEENCMYGVDDYQYSYKANDANAVVEDPDNPASGTNPISLGKTGAGYMRIVVTTWIEGWSLLDHGYEDNATGNTNTAVWDPEQYVNKKFNVGIRLGVKSHESDHQN